MSQKKRYIYYIKLLYLTHNARILGLLNRVSHKSPLCLTTVLSPDLFILSKPTEFNGNVNIKNQQTKEQGQVIQNTFVSPHFSAECVKRVLLPLSIVETFSTKVA